MPTRLKSFPVAWVTSGRNLLIVGGGAETDGRIRHAVRFDWARIRVVVPPANKLIRDMSPGDARVELFERAATEDDVTWAHLVIEDSGSRTVAEQLDRWCEVHRVPLNAMDKPELCDLFYMSMLIRDPLVISITSGGSAPALSSSLRKHLDEKIGPGWAFAAQALAEARERLPSGQARIDLLKRVVADPRFLEMIGRNDEAGMVSFVENELRSVRA